MNHSKEINIRSSLRLPRCPQFKVFQNKGAVLVLFLSLFGNTVFHVFSASNCFTVVQHFIDPIILVAASTSLYPLLGWLADVYFGRYKLIKWCLRIMWIVSVSLCLVSVLLDYYVPSSEHNGLKYILYVPLTISLGGFQANIIQFGIDQMVDASSVEITSFIRWCSWLWFFSRPFVISLQTCFCNEHFKSISLLLLPLLLTIAVSLDCIFNSSLIKEPPSSNPLALIFKVLQYAARNKYPRLHSAFTYWDDKRFSRIDLGKSKYGGPFTSEEVENVKTFWRMIGTIAVGSIFIGMTFNVYPIVDEMFKATDTEGIYYYESCFRAFSMNYFGVISVCMLFPVFEFVLYPFLVRCFQVSILTKFIHGIVFFLLSIIGYTSIEGVGHYLIKEANQYTNLSCPKDDHCSHQPLPIDSAWIILPSIFNAVAQFFFMISSAEFLCAQSPYSMKGLLFGLAYGCVGLFTVGTFILLLPIQYAIEQWSPSHYGCEMWYLLSVSLFLLTITVVCHLVIRWYGRRLRDNNLVNEQMFAIHYYSQQ